MGARRSTPMAAGRDAVCPKCGAPLEFTSDMLGYGQTIEQCSRGVSACGYWATLETIVRPAIDTPAPRGAEPKRRVNRMGAPGVRRCTDETYERILAALPADEAAAIMAPQLAARAEISVSLASNVLSHAVHEGRALKRDLPKVQLLGRPPVGYWRRA
jgi:hypothetical protein